MTILDELAALARERHYGHGERAFIERVVCLISRVPVEWCAGCRRGLHRTTRLPVVGSEPDYCPRCTPMGYGACRCEIASNE